jgi:chromosome segregation ATPase
MKLAEEQGIKLGLQQEINKNKTEIIKHMEQVEKLKAAPAAVVEQAKHVVASPKEVKPDLILQQQMAALKAEYENYKIKKENEIRSLQEKYTEKTKELEKKKQEVPEVKYIESKEVDVSSYEKSISRLKDEKSSLQRKLDICESTINSLKEANIKLEIKTQAKEKVPLRNEEVEKLEKQLEQTENAASDLKTEKSKLEKKMEQVNRTVNSLKEEKAKLEKDLETSENAVTTMKNERAKKEKELKADLKKAQDEASELKEEITTQKSEKSTVTSSALKDKEATIKSLQKKLESVTDEHESLKASSQQKIEELTRKLQEARKPVEQRPTEDNSAVIRSLQDNIDSLKVENQELEIKLRGNK